MSRRENIMKKIWAVVSLFLLMTSVSFVHAAEETLQEKVQKAVSKAATPSNKGAIKENKVAHVTVVDRFGNGVDIDGEDMIIAANVYTYGCKAYALHPNWLLVAGTCVHHLDPEPFHDPFSPAKFAMSYVAAQTPEEELDYNGNILLIWRDKPLYKAPFIKVLAVSTPQQLFALTATHQVQINTARLGLDKVVDRTLKSGSIKKDSSGQVLFQLDETWTDLSGTATDPLFLISATSNEFLAGYNNGVLDYQARVGRSSPDWYTLSESDLKFIKDTVQENRPQDWSFIKTRLFFNQTKTPYFK